MEKTINVAASIRAARDGYEFIKVIDYGSMSGFCEEGHTIRFGFLFRQPETGEEIILGGTCQWKVFLFKRWKNLSETNIDQELLKLGEVFWMISERGMEDEVLRYLDSKSLHVDISEVPPKEKRKEIKERLIFGYKNVKKMNVLKEKEKEKREKEAKKKELQQKIIEEDRDFIELKSFKFKDADDEGTRGSLVEYYESMFERGRLHCWSEKQRRLARYLIMKNSGLIKDTLDERQKELIKLMKFIKDRISNEYLEQFLFDMIRGKRFEDRNLTDKQKNLLINIIRRNNEGEYKIEWDFTDYIRNHL